MASPKKTIGYMLTDGKTHDGKPSGASCHYHNGDIAKEDASKDHLFCWELRVPINWNHTVEEIEYRLVN